MSAAPPSPRLDPRVHAYRADLADGALEGRVAAARYVTGQPWRCALGRAAIHKAPEGASMQISELLFGEAVACFEQRDGWAWVQCAHDGYVGYVPADALAPDDGAGTASHVVCARHGHVYAAPDVKAPITGDLYCASPLTVAEESSDGTFLALAGGGWVPRAQTAPAGQYQPDIAATAEAFLGTPYRWGGRSGAGIDCSGLVQIALMRAGLGCPRDSDQQAAALGTDIGQDIEALQRGDLVFFPGHVGIMADRQHLIHANATHMAVSIDPLRHVIGIVQRAQPDRPVRALKRLA